MIATFTLSFFFAEDMGLLVDMKILMKGHRLVIGFFWPRIFRGHGDDKTRPVAELMTLGVQARISIRCIAFKVMAARPAIVDIHIWIFVLTDSAIPIIESLCSFHVVSHDPEFEWSEVAPCVRSNLVPFFC